MSFIITQPEPQPEPAVRTNTTKQKALADAIKKLFTGLPAGTTPDQIDIFALSVALRKPLPTGLLTEDFDGNDVQAIVDDLLKVV